MSNRDPALQNVLLANMSRSALDVLRTHLEPVSLSVRQVLETPNKLITHFYFPIGDVNSIVAGNDEQRLEVEIVGRDGMTGVCVVLGGDASPHECFTQIAGDALRIAVADLNAAVETEPMLRKHFLLYIRSLLLQTAQTALADVRYTIEERLARWLLMCQDRLDDNDVPLSSPPSATIISTVRPMSMAPRGPSLAVIPLPSTTSTQASRSVEKRRCRCHWYR